MEALPAWQVSSQAATNFSLLFIICTTLHILSTALPVLSWILGLSHGRAGKTTYNMFLYEFIGFFLFFFIQPPSNGSTLSDYMRSISFLPLEQSGNQAGISDWAQHGGHLMTELGRVANPGSLELCAGKVAIRLRYPCRRREERRRLLLWNGSGMEGIKIPKKKRKFKMVLRDSRQTAVMPFLIECVVVRSDRTG